MIDGKPQIDPHSETARALVAIINDMIEPHRRTCETPGTEHADTEHARGALVSLRGLLKHLNPSNMQSGPKTNLE